MSAPFLITGGTGTLGRLMTPLLQEAGCELRILSRGRHESADGIEYVTGDLSTGEGLDAAVTGVSTIVHLAGSAKGDDEKALHLVRAASRAGTAHLIYISVVGAERVPVTSAIDRAMFNYFRFKRAAERVIEDSGLPFTTLRASQFYELALMVSRQMAKLPVIPVPSGMKVQPIDAGEVAQRLTELTLGKPAGLVPDVAGPRVYGMDEMIRLYLRAAGRRRPMMKIRMFGGAYRAMRAGANLAPDHAVGRKTWEEFLDEHLR